MWYQFDLKGKCISNCDHPVEPMPKVISVECKEVYNDILNVKLIDGEVCHLEPEKSD